MLLARYLHLPVGFLVIYVSDGQRSMLTVNNHHYTHHSICCETRHLPSLEQPDTKTEVERAGLVQSRWVTFILLARVARLSASASDSRVKRSAGVRGRLPTA